MRKRFEQQMQIGQIPISDLQLNPKSTNALDQLIAALKEIYCNGKYNEKIYSILEELLDKKEKNNGRPGMDLWVIFVLAQVRLCMNYSYDMLHHQANNDYRLRCLLGLETDKYWPVERTEYAYQQIYDNVSGITDEILVKVNAVIVEFGHREVFKKKKIQYCA